MGSIISVLITAGLGTWLAYVWQQRSVKQTRYFEASKTQFELMRQAAADFANVIGRRLYATHRVCVLPNDNERFDSSFKELVLAIEDWNNQYLKIELNVRTLFVRSTAADLERLQARLAPLTNDIIDSAKSGNRRRKRLTGDVALIRQDYFRFIQAMNDEADHLFRQMHFGIKLYYTRWDISYFSTLQLIKALFSGAENESAVTRSPTDFGLPVGVYDARLRVN